MDSLYRYLLSKNYEEALLERLFFRQLLRFLSDGFDKGRLHRVV